MKIRQLRTHQSTINIRPAVLWKYVNSALIKVLYKHHKSKLATIIISQQKQNIEIINVWCFITCIYQHLPSLIISETIINNVFFKGCGMGPWLVLVCPSFRENVVATCKIGSFLCSLVTLFQKNVIVLFFFLFGNQISKWCSFEKGAIFDLLFTFFSHQGKSQKFLQHISHSHTYTYFAHPIDFFCLTNFEKKIRIYQTWFLFGMSSSVDSFRAILEQLVNNKMVSKI